jgi:hypothetical protein
MSQEEENVTFNLELRTERAVDPIRQVESIAYRTLALVRRLGLPENVNQAISYVQRFVGVIRLLHSSLNMLMASAGPLGWLMMIQGALGVATAAASFSDLHNDIRGAP